MTRNVLKTLGSARVALAVAVGLPLLIVSSAYAQDPAASPAGGTTGTPVTGNAGSGTQAEVERVVVTGSNIPTAEEVGPNPVDTYRRDDISRIGATTSTELIQRIPSITGSADNENFNNGNGFGGTAINLRGIDPKETLILQDGRRLANVGFAGSFVDFNVIPFGLIDHIDILKDGASPVYGSDAVAGVVNVFLIHRFRGLETFASYGNTNMGFANDMGQEKAYLLAGTGDDKTDIVVYAEVFNEAGILSRDVHISHDADKTTFGGLDNRRSGNYAGRVNRYVFQPRLAGGAKSPTPRSQPNPNTLPTPRPTITGQYQLRTTLSKEKQLFNFSDFAPLKAPQDRQYLYGSVIRDLCDKYLTVFADFKYFRQYFESGLAAAPFTPDVFTDAAHPFGLGASGISVPTQNPFTPFTNGFITSPGGSDPKFPNTQASGAFAAGTKFTTGVRYRGIEAGVRTDKILTNNYEFTGGLKGELGEFGDYLKTWNWETGFRYNEDYRIERFGGIINNNALRTALLSTDPATAFNAFGLGQNSKKVLDQVFVTTDHLGKTEITLEDLKINGDLFNLPAGPVSFAVGGDHRTEHTRDDPDALVSSGQTTGATNFAPTKGSRDVWGVFWETRIPVTSPTWNVPGLYSLEVDYAERFDSFSDFGKTERPKFSIRWQPIDTALTLRASYIEAFHAPALGELFSGVSQSFPGVSDPLPGNATEAQVEAHISGNKNLKPETAYEWTYGGVVTPGKWWSALQGLTMSADFVHIDIRGFTATLDPQQLIDLNFKSGAFASQITRDANNNNAILVLLLPLQNLGREIVDSWDYELVYEFQTSRLGHGDFGTFTTTINGTYLADADIQFLPPGNGTASKFIEVSGKFGAGFQGTNGEGNYTHNRLYTSLFYDGAAGSWLGGVDMGATVHFVGQYNDVAAQTINNHDRKVREWITLDAILNYTFNFPAPATQNEVAGYAKDGGKNVKMKDGKDKNVMPVSTAEYNPCGWRAWLNKTTLTLGMNNVTDEQPPFVAGAGGSGDSTGFDEGSANAKGRFWYVAVKKRF